MEQAYCCICGEPVDETNSASCNNCYQPFHLNQRNDRPGKDCGEVWINEQYLSLEFACFACLGRSLPEAAQTVSATRRRVRTALPRPARRRYRKQP